MKLVVESGFGKPDEEHHRLSFQGRAVTRLAKLKLTPHPKGRRLCGISFSLSKRAELALALRAMMHSLAVAPLAKNVAGR
jgi:hypothetical protein